MGVTDEYFASVLSVITGVQYATANLIKVGERVLNLERLYNNREGFTTKNDILLLWLLTEVPVDGMSKGWVSNLEPMLKEYYRTRGWNENGVPTRKKLTELVLAELA